jgi:hypothetical protein
MSEHKVVLITGVPSGIWLRQGYQYRFPIE